MCTVQRYDLSVLRRYGGFMEEGNFPGWGQGAAAQSGFSHQFQAARMNTKTILAVMPCFALWLCLSRGRQSQAESGAGRARRRRLKHGVLRQPRLRRFELECRRQARRPGTNRRPVAALPRRSLNDQHDEQHGPPLQAAIVQAATENANTHWPGRSRCIENGLDI